MSPIEAGCIHAGVGVGDVILPLLDALSVAQQTTIGQVVGVLCDSIRHGVSSVPPVQAHTVPVGERTVADVRIGILGRHETLPAATL